MSLGEIQYVYITHHIVSGVCTKKIRKKIIIMLLVQFAGIYFRRKPNNDGPFEV